MFNIVIILVIETLEYSMYVCVHVHIGVCNLLFITLFITILHTYNLLYIYVCDLLNFTVSV